MSGLLSQIKTVVVMNVLSLPRRLWMSLAAVFAVSVVVAVLLAFLAMAKGFEQHAWPGRARTLWRLPPVPVRSRS